MSIPAPSRPRFLHDRVKSHWIATHRFGPRWTRLMSVIALFAGLGLWWSYQHSDPDPFIQIPRASNPITYGDPLRILQGPPTSSFWDNLQPNVKYITGFVGGGYTNDFMTYVNVILLAQMTRRTAIMPPFTPSHIGRNETHIPFGDVFDIPRAAEELRLHIIEWRDVKNVTQPQSDLLGCWTVWAAYDNGPRGGRSRDNRVEGNLGLDISYTKVPSASQTHDAPPFMNAWALATLGFPSGWNAGVTENSPMTSGGPLKHIRRPDQQLLCFDFLYFMNVVRPHINEWEEDYSPAWQIATHIHWTKSVTDLANAYLMRLFGVSSPVEIPPFISIHVRHGDFKNLCREVPVSDCFAPLPVIDRRVREVQKNLQRKFPGIGGGKHIPVLMTSDERDPAWWENVKQLGWLTIDHGPEGEDTVAKYGKWHVVLHWFESASEVNRQSRWPVFLDSVFQSMGKGFVGTTESTMSVVARRRVEDWQDGVTRMFKWGWVGADDH